MRWLLAYVVVGSMLWVVAWCWLEKRRPRDVVRAHGGHSVALFLFSSWLLVAFGWPVFIAAFLKEFLKTLRKR